MDRDLQHWLQKYQNEILQRWWAVAQESGLVSEALLERLTQDVVDSDSFRVRLLAFLAADASLPSHWLDVLAREPTQSDFLALLSALRQVLVEFLIRHAEPQEMAGWWPVLNRQIDRTGLAVTGAVDIHMVRLDAEREHWQTLYNLARELSASIDLNYVLQKAISRILDALEADRGAVLLLDPATGLVTPRAAQDWPDVSLNLFHLPPEWQRGHGSSITLKAGESGEGALKVLLGAKAETVIAAPLLANGQFHGILVVATSDANGFDSQRRSLIQAVVSNIASNVGNAQVTQTLTDQSRELGLMLRQQQQESSKREAILASIADGVVVNDQHGQIILVNRAAELILNAQAQDLMGRDLENLFDLFTAGARQDISKAMMTVLDNPEIELLPDVARTALEIGNRTISARLAPVTTEGGEFLGIVTIFRDITKEIEADRAKGEFVSTVSHELRTPMTAIKGFTDLIHSEAVGEINDDQKRFLGIIKNNTDRLTALINDLLDISQVETGRVRFEPESVRLGDIVQSVVDVLAPNADNKSHSLTCRIEAGLPEIKADPNRLNQVFTNLVGNAINYTSEGGKISVDVYRVQGAIRADVRDNGIGICSEELSKIFERFYRADHPVVQESRGTGLGLSIVKMFVEMHGGRVWAESEPGEGSAFTILLPLPTEEQKGDPEQIWSKATLELEQRQVLVADDDPDIAELVKLYLEEAGYGTMVVGRGVKVLEVARRHNPDLIILDILLPDMDGRAVLEALKSEPATADIPVVMLTVIVDDGIAFDLGAAGYLTKPISKEDLLQTVQLAFSRRGRILVVEDNVDTIEMVRLALRRVGYNVDIAAEGYEALSLARRWRPQAILLDLRLPGMDGYEALTHLKRSPATQGIPIVVTSAHVADLERETKRLKSLGVVSFLPKPFTVNQLVKEIDHVARATERTREEEKSTSS